MENGKSICKKQNKKNYEFHEFFEFNGPLITRTKKIREIRKIRSR